MMASTARAPASTAGTAAGSSRTAAPSATARQSASVARPGVSVIAAVICLSRTVLPGPGASVTPCGSSGFCAQIA
jgi:hypothetical protein